MCWTFGNCTCWWHKMKGQGITEVIVIQHFRYQKCLDKVCYQKTRNCSLRQCWASQDCLPQSSSWMFWLVACQQAKIAVNTKSPNFLMWMSAEHRSRPLPRGNLHAHSKVPGTGLNIDSGML